MRRFTAAGSGPAFAPSRCRNCRKIAITFIDRIWARNKGINRRWKLASGFEAVADSAQRFQIAGMAWIALDFLPQTAHEDVNGARGHKRPFFPHRVEELVAGKDASPVPGQIFEEPLRPPSRRAGAWATGSP